MGLTTWKHAPKGKIRKHDIITAKNYLDEKELDYLNRIVSMYLDYAELQAKNKKMMYMNNWIHKLDAFLQFNEQEILQGKGKISQEVAKQLVETEFKKYIDEQDRLFESDFDKITKRLLNKTNEVKDIL